MSPKPTPSPTGVAPSPSASSSSSSPKPQATPSPRPNYPPIPPLPDVPSNTYQLLLNLSSAIDSTSGSFQTSTGKLSGIHSTTNTAVGGIVANSKGETTNGLNDIWYYTKQDFTNASTPLTSMTAANALGGSPNQLQEVLNQHQADIQNGVPAVEQLRHLVATGFASNPSVDAVQNLVDLAANLTNALGNVNMALWLMISAISNINSGIAYACATGLVPGQPFPTFSPHAFAMEGNGGSGGSGSNLTAEQLQSYLEDQGVDSDTALDIALYAEEQGLSLDEIQKMFNTLLQGGGMVEADSAASQIQEWINNQSLSRWLEARPGGNLSDVTALLNNDFSTEAVTTLLNQGADLKSTLTSAQYLLTRTGGRVNIGDINQWAQQGLNLKYAARLVNRGVSPDWITSNISDYASTDPGVKGWTTLSKGTKSDIAAALQRWATRRRTGIGNDGTNFGNRPQSVIQNGHRVQRTPFPGPYSGPYTEYDVGTTNDRIVVNKNGIAYYFPSIHGHYHPNDAILIPNSFIAQILGG